jgi:predicted ATP-binding protein involved in virulence
VYIKRLDIKNLRSLEAVSLAFNAPGAQGMLYPNVNVLLGSNGRGKTSILRAAALATLGPLLSASSGFVPDSLIRRPQAARALSRAAFEKLPPALMTAQLALETAEWRGNAKSALTELSLTTSVEPLGSRERLGWRCEPAKAAKLVESEQFDDRSTAFFVVAYGATRRVEASTRVDESARSKSRLPRYERVSSLFEDHLALMPLSYWLPAYAKRNPGRYTQVLHLLDDLLPADCRIHRKASETDLGTEHMFSMNGVPLPFRALSDGYRAYIGWIGDMLFHVCMGAGSGQKLRELSGLVLVDEIDLHLHPDWQRVVLPTLAKALPRVQFIVTTHSPLVVGSLEADNLFVLEAEDGATHVKRLAERVHGRSAEQILLSPYFGLESTRAPVAARKLEALAGQASRGDMQASMEYLALLSAGMSRKDLTQTPDQPAPAAARAGSARKKKEVSEFDTLVSEALQKIGAKPARRPARRASK